MESIERNNGRFFEILTHLIGWGMLLGFPFLFLWNKNGEPIDWIEYLRHSIVTMFFCIIFYLNYFLLIPRYLFCKKRQKYLIVNILLVTVFGASIQLWQTYLSPDRSSVPEMKLIVLFFMRDVFTMILTIGLAAAIHLSKKWAKTERARQDAERDRTEAELKNLRNQLNPHFLLNTLNNIYALVAFDAEKAQMAIQELSKLLRHVLYENQQTYVSLGKEMDFIRNYIALMEIRLSAHVTVETHIDIDPDSRTEVAPLIFISLIENAFKHGISPTKPSFIRISFAESESEIFCEIVNSYHPKTSSDKSGSGIGLEQVSKRLELLYPGRYEWYKGVNAGKTEYVSRLTIKTEFENK